MKNIISCSVSPESQRYPTCGDYWEDEHSLQFRITKQPISKWEAAVFLHEFVEFMLSKDRGITEQEITDFDLKWETMNKRGLNREEEPGDEVEAPYHKEHEFAKKLEKMFADELGINWEEYNENLIYQQNGKSES